MPQLSGKKIVIGVGGGIAAYKVCGIIRHFTESGADVRVIPTAAALEFVGAATFEALSGNKVSVDVFADIPQVPHVKLGQQADLVLIAPATADLLSRAAAGRADDLLTATLLTATCPVILAPAMHTEMWEHPATQRNVATLRGDGYTVLTPDSGRLTGADTGAGRLPDPAEIILHAEQILEDRFSLPYDLAGVSLLISAGGTCEPLDPVRFLGNRSSGKQGFALARVAAQRGATVTLVAGNTVEMPVPANTTVVKVATALDMEKEISARANAVDVVIMAAAVADFRPTMPITSKIKKTENSGPAPIELTTNPDILHSLVTNRADGKIPPHCVIVGFAAETGDETTSVLEFGRQKLRRKGCDLLVVNTVGEGKAFGTEHNTGWILDSAGSEMALAESSKSLLASRVLDAVQQMRAVT